MNASEHHQLLTDLLDEALQHEPQERAAFLAQACAANVQLRREVESLLASFDESSDFIETPALNLFPDETDEAMEGRQIGHYRIMHEIGRGGMGVVYLAERADEYQEQVALKIVKRGMDTDFVVRRFRHERQILASLHHPNIARLLDGGTTEDGRPYFVMEYIEGEPIDEYCQHHDLSLSERLKLFRIVCAAVHYAHQNLVVHRDIKPGNILITSAPDGKAAGKAAEVKLLDFGIAKIFNPEISQTIEKTATLMRLMTPEYASPEQVRGLPVTTASDVYSLGVVLYELLTGHRPYRITSILPSDIERVICEQEPTRPSTREGAERSGGEGERRKDEEATRSATPAVPFSLSQLQGDLDNIVLMALRKEPLRRYASVEQFSEDLCRHLEGLPVIARGDKFSYRASKFIQRHKAGVAAAALIVLSLIAGLITTIWQARRAQAQQAKAERRFNDVRKLANAYLFEFHDAIEKLQGATQARELVVKRALEYLDSLAREAGDDPSLQEELAAAYLKVGDVQGRPGFPNLGQKGEAMQSYRKALTLREALLATGIKSLEFRRDLATNYDRIGDTLRTIGDSTRAIEHYRKSLALREEIAAADATMASRSALATSYQRIGDTLALTGDGKGALENQRRALPLFEVLAKAEPNNAKAQRDVFIGCIKLGDRLLVTGDIAGAMEKYRQALLISQALAKGDWQNARAQRELAISHDKIGNALKARKETSAALVSYRAALEIRQRLASDERNAEAQRDLSISYDKIGEILAMTGKTEEAIQSYRQALTIDTALSLTDQENAQSKLDRANSLEKIGELLTQKGDWTGAQEQHRQALALRADVTKADKANADATLDLASSYVHLGEMSAKLAGQSGQQAQWHEAKQQYQRGLDILQELQQRGALSQAAAGEPDRIKNEIAKCDAALK